ncbi:GBS Bsp-like repeat-containing protein [Enterococcus sp. CWB-B31]|uniref:GBS Bsp-like repeat-containing protein n=1 Tax=Enterococcus sp. CWB-B31 TaxID=2885159 RepID=UPI001E54AE92|nr:GBS Bsp-like repeat-containing protein [Enterococcus sp. CWB-B31]MCB5956213.1 GBS Bsp-like repeat-containing protein [Enterococcus sp. CWB-B31]
MNRKLILSLLVCGDLLVTSLIPTIVVSAEGSTGMENSVNTQTTENLTGNQLTGNSLIQETISSESNSSRNDFETIESSTSTEIEALETIDSEEATDEQSFDVNTFGEGYTEPSPSSRSDLIVASRATTALAAIDIVNAGESNRPKLSFIDVSSHNGTITTSQYQMMKNYGVTGVVVKLTEGTTYFNPYAQSQIANAKAAGLKVSVYHYSHYTSTAGAQAEAKYFVNKANSLSLSKDTVMVADIEESSMRTSAVNANTQAFKAQLNNSGYSKVAYYLSRSWLDVAGGVFSSSIFGKENIWVAQYPYTPTASQNWNSDYSSWQWSSNFYFPGISHPFDVNTDYTGLFTGESDKWDSSIPVSGTISVSDVSGSEQIFKASAKVEAGGYTPHKVYFPTWSNENGQDNTIWYEAAYSNGIWTADIPITNHKTAGDYTIHAYVQMLPTSSMNIFIGSAEFTITPVTMSAVITNYNTQGTFDVVVTGNSVSGIDRVRLPVWSKANQSDLYWYDAVKQADGTYKATIDVKNHQYNSGMYTVHAYIYGKNGLSQGMALSQQMDVTGVSVNVTFTDAKKTETNYIATAAVSPGITGTAKEVNFAVWSEKNGQDDIKWYKATKQSNGTFTTMIDINNHKTIGQYNVHTYVTVSTGVMKFASADKFTVSSPTVSVFSKNIQNNKGTFDVVVEASAPSGIKEIKVPVWSKSDQSDIKWYNASKQSNGTYKVTVDTRNHQYNSSIYQAHAYVYTNNSLTGFGAMVPASISLPAIKGLVSAAANASETTYTATLTMDLGIYGTATEVTFPVWSEKNGQDDIKWYKATKQSNGKYTATINISNHKDSGKYNLHVYAKLANGVNKFVAATEFSVTQPTVLVSKTAFNKSTGTFSIRVTGGSKSGIKNVKIPVWSKRNQSDIKWYDGVKQSDGSYKVTVDIKNHGGNTGVYNVHTYLYANNGVTGFAATTVTVEK